MPKLPGKKQWDSKGRTTANLTAGPSSSPTVDSLLSGILQLAVPLWIDQLRKYDWNYVLGRVKECSQFIAEHGDNILCRSKKKGESAKAFNYLAEGIACLAFCPGGVKMFGEHWEATLQSDRDGADVQRADSFIGLYTRMLRALRRQ